MKTYETNWTLMLCCILAGIILGMVIMFFIFVFSFERVLNASQGIVSNVEINVNETKMVYEVMNWTLKYYPDKFSNITYTYYSDKLNHSCNGLIDKGCTEW